MRRHSTPTACAAARARGAHRPGPTAAIALRRSTAARIPGASLTCASRPWLVLSWVPLRAFPTGSSAGARAPHSFLTGRLPWQPDDHALRRKEERPLQRPRGQLDEQVLIAVPRPSRRTLGRRRSWLVGAGVLYLEVALDLEGAPGRHDRHGRVRIFCHHIFAKGLPGRAASGWCAPVSQAQGGSNGSLAERVDRVVHGSNSDLIGSAQAEDLVAGSSHEDARRAQGDGALAVRYVFEAHPGPMVGDAQPRGFGARRRGRSFEEPQVVGKAVCLRLRIEDSGRLRRCECGSPRGGADPRGDHRRSTSSTSRAGGSRCPFPATSRGTHHRGGRRGEPSARATLGV